jgi:hypothetical protein
MNSEFKTYKALMVGKTRARFLELRALSMAARLEYFEKCKIHMALNSRNNLFRYYNKMVDASVLAYNAERVHRKALGEFGRKQRANLLTTK